MKIKYLSQSASPDPDNGHVFPTAETQKHTQHKTGTYPITRLDCPLVIDEYQVLTFTTIMEMGTLMDP